MALASIIILLILALPASYLFLLALASVRIPPSPVVSDHSPSTRFAVVIPAHDEGWVIGSTVRQLRLQEYPPDLFDVHVVADHCSDDTASLARQAGASVHERNQGPRTGKGAALVWWLERVLDDDHDAVVIFDSDTQVAPDFLRIMDAHMADGDQVVQGQHVIRNPEDGWFPALTWAMFIVDNRFQNLGRTNLGWSAKHMGDSMCIRADVLREVGWGDGLTEDYQLRQILLLAGYRIVYEPVALGYGEAPRTWSQARKQRARWLRGTRDASRQFARRLFLEGARRRDMGMLDGALQAHLPSYSTLTLLCVILLSVQVLVNWFIWPVFPNGAVAAWMATVGALFAYPLFGLALENAPPRAYLAILSGPFFILWRTWLALTARLGGKPVVWIRTTHGGQR